MDFLKELFNAGPLSWEAFSAAINEKGFKLADLSKGSYVAKKKYDDDLAAKDSSITDLNAQLTQRDTDIEGLKTQISAKGTDSETKITELNNQITKLQGEYEKTKTDYESKLSKQSYEFAVKEFAGTKKFSSKAAQRDFINEMLTQNLQVKDNTIMGAEDFVKNYSEQNSDAFVTEETKPEGASEEGQTTPPMFIAPKTGSVKTPGTEDLFAKAFHFTGVRTPETKDNK